MRIVVVGGTGNVGTALMRAVRGPDAITSAITSVDVISRRGGVPHPAPGVGEAHVHQHVMDVATATPSSPNGKRLAALCAGADAVVHLAWQVQPSHDRTALREANVTGTANVLGAVARGHAKQVVVASSAGAYAPSPDDDPRGETWPAYGVHSSAYSMDKVAVERLLDEFTRRRRGTIVTALRPATTLQASAGPALRRTFIGPLAPRWAFRPGRVPVLPWPKGLRIQVVHADDVAAAYVSAIVRRVPGAFNLAAPEVLGAEEVAAAIGVSRVVSLPESAVRAGVQTAWWARALPVDRGWLEMALAAPVLDTSRAERQLGWIPARDAVSTLREAFEGLSRKR